ncbi:MAG: hypothetical protein R3C15_01075 [Thermoleophilia bacterium]
MKQQVRLRVLIPLALVAVAGLLVWKFVLADDGAQPVAEPAAIAPQPAAPDAPAAAAPADAVAPGTSAPAADGDLAASLTEICEETRAEIDALDYGTTPTAAEAALRRAVGIQADAVTRIGALSTVGEQSATLAELQATVRQTHDVSAEALAALVDDRYVRAFGLIDRSQRLSTKSDELALELGAAGCEDEQATAAGQDEDVDAATYAVADRLDDTRVVVVVLYSPDADVDAVTLREARAGALAAKASFVAIDGTRDAAIRVIASKLDLRETPAVLVFERNGGLSTRLDGFADRQTVAQAVANAKAPA